MNDQNLVSGKFSYKAAWQGAKQLCSGVRAKFFCMLFLFAVCSSIALFVLSFFFPQDPVITSHLAVGAVLPAILKTLLNCFIGGYFLLYFYQLFLSRNKLQNPQYAYKISLKDVIAVTVVAVCANVVTFIIPIVVLLPMDVTHSVTTMPLGLLIPVIMFMFIIAIVASSLVLLMVVRRVHTGESWLNVLRFSIKRFLRYSWRLIVFFLFAALIFVLFAVVVFAIQFVATLLLHDLLLSGGLEAHIIVILASIVGIAVLLFMCLRYHPIFMALPCSIYLCSYTADGVKPVSDEGGKDDVRPEK